ncbi:hypothetical protein CRYUN_Cryun18bG0135800 [Craigia yunnanensis]
MPATATLRNCKGRCWYVEVNKCDDNMYFEKGWRRFIDENSIKDSDFLVFSYVGWSVFDVKVLGLDGCEKSVSHVLLEEQEVEIVLVEEGERWEEQEEEEDDDNNFLEEGEDCELDEEEEEANDDDDYQEEKDSRQELEEENMMMTVKKERSIKEIEDGMRDLLLCTKICPRFNPYFVARIRLRRRNELRVPRDVIEDYDLTLKD